MKSLSLANVIHVVRPCCRVATVLSLLACSMVQAGDTSYYGVIKAEQLFQAPGHSPERLPTNAFVFTAFVVPTTNYAITNATVQPPGKPVRTLETVPGGAALQFIEQFNTQEALDTTYPSSGGLFNPSIYTFVISATNDGIRTAKCSYLLSSNPSVPNLSDLEAAQSIDTTADFTLKWASLGGTSLDVVQLLIIDSASNSIFASPLPFTSNALNGTSVSITIPAYTLPPSMVLTGYLTIGRPGLPNTSDYAGATGVAALAKVTGFSLVTRPAPNPPVLTAIPLGREMLRLQFTTETNRHYHLLAVTNFSDFSWDDLLETNPVSDTVTFTDSKLSERPQRFYQIRIGP
jgi:hypothetical protein